MMRISMLILATMVATTAVHAQVVPTTTTPEEIAMYQDKATSAAAMIIYQVDGVKAFQASPEFGDLFTSAAVQARYDDRLTTLAATLRMVQAELMTTATGVLSAGQKQLNAAREMMRYRATDSY